MTGAKGIHDLFADFDQFLKVASKAAAAMRPSAEKDLVAETVARLKVAREGADARLLAGLEALRESATGMKARAEQLAAEVTATRSALIQAAADRVAAAAAKVAEDLPAAAPAFAPDLGLGAKLREELLARLGHPAANGAEPPRPGRDIWEDWK